MLPDDVVDNNLADNTVKDLTQEASMSLTKEAELQDTNNNGVPDVDEKIIYTFTVADTGAAPLSNLTVDDPVSAESAPPGGQPGDATTVDLPESRWRGAGATDAETVKIRHGNS
ncbi:protein of unknown function [Nitratireductor aquimarinus]|uniref:DUF7507 domain-containing protein n=1 Tax=Nitratireductor aquimarinus TaxID=889300 RepID=UPI003B5A2BF9